jgi:hypothetical protein
MRLKVAFPECRTQPYALRYEEGALLMCAKKQKIFGYLNRDCCHGTDFQWQKKPELCGKDKTAFPNTTFERIQ